MNISGIYSTEQLTYFNKMWPQADSRPNSYFKLIVENELGRFSFVGISDEELKANVLVDLVEVISEKSKTIVKVKNK